MSLLEEIDKWRDEAARLIELKRAKPPLAASIEELNRQAAEAHHVRCTLEGVEAKIDTLVIEYMRLPRCPYPPCTGRLEPTPTKHVLKCSKCLATTLPGRMISERVGTLPIDS